MKAAEATYILRAATMGRCCMQRRIMGTKQRCGYANITAKDVDENAVLHRVAHSRHRAVVRLLGRMFTLRNGGTIATTQRSIIE